MAIKRVQDLPEYSISDNTIISLSSLFELTDKITNGYISKNITYSDLVNSLKNSLKDWLSTQISCDYTDIQTGLPIGSIFYSSLSYDKMKAVMLSSDDKTLKSNFAPCSGKTIRKNGDSDFLLDEVHFATLTSAIDSKPQSNYNSYMYYDGAGDNTTVYLPNLDSYYIKNVNTSITDHTYTSAGLPNITGSINAAIAEGGSDAFSVKANSVTKIHYIGTPTNINGISFDASKSNNIYGRSETVTPNSVNLLPYVVIGSTSSRIVTDLKFGDQQ